MFAKYLNPRRYFNYGYRKLGLIYTRLTLPKQMNAIKQRWSLDDVGEMDRLKANTLGFLARCHHPEEGIGAYGFKPGGPSILYASCYAALTLHLYGELQQYTRKQKQSWVEYINAFQDDDGIFRDKKIACPGAETLEWWGWHHLTLHTLMTLEALGGVTPKTFTIIERFKEKGSMAKWLDSLGWQESAANASNHVQNYGTLLQYDRDFHGIRWCAASLDEMFNWLDLHQNNNTGLWGTRFDTPYTLSQGVQAGYHLWMLYFYDHRQISHTQQIIDSCLATQNRFGGFGPSLNSSACEDIDSIDPLVRLARQSGYRNDEVERSLAHAMYWILANFKENGGAVFRRHETLNYGHALMSAGVEEPTLFPTWFRTLCLAYLGQHLTQTAVGRYSWQFLSGPGHQFFFGNERSLR